MNPPSSPRQSFLMGNLFCFLALGSWGIGSERLLLGFAMGTVLLLASFSPYRLHSSAMSRSRSTELTFVIIFASAIWFYLQRQSLRTNVAIHLLTLCPVFLFPKLLFSSLQAEPFGAVAKTSKRDGAAIARRWLEAEYPFSRGHLDKRRPLEFQTAYVLLALFIATFTLPWRAGVPLVLIGTLYFVLLQNGLPRFGRGSAASWALCSVLICLMGAGAGGFAIERGQQFAEEYFSQLWSNRFQDAGSSSSASSTAIGGRGKIDNGSRLLMRLEQPLGQAQNYLRNGVFAFTSNGTHWFARSPAVPALERTLFPGDGNSFEISERGKTAISVRIFQAKISLTLGRERSALALPVGSRELFGLPLSKLELNDMGVPTVAGSRGFVKFGVSFDPDSDGQPAPKDGDLDVPLPLQGLIDSFIAESKADAPGLSPIRRAQTIAEYFRAHWEYTLNLEGRDGSPRSLPTFLRMDRRGHCEYFATVTTMALRRMGIPARYATGFLITEFDEREKLYWVRTRDAHAWSTYWDGSAWQTADSTPGSTSDSESWTAAGSDWIARIQYWLEDFDPAASIAKIDNAYLWALSAAMLALIAYKFRLKKARPALAALDEQAQALSNALSRATGVDRSARETSFEHWRRGAGSLALEPELLALADRRESAMFMPIDDRLKALEQAESDARTLTERVNAETKERARRARRQL